MSTKDPNMKVIIGADTHDFDKGAKEVKQGLKDLDKTGNQALSALGSAFGVNTGKISQMVSAMKGLGEKFSQTGDMGVKAFGSILKSIGPVGGAIAGLGLAAAIEGFRSLKQEAEDFKTTVEGTSLEMATLAYVETYRRAFAQMNGDAGKAYAEAESNLQKLWGAARTTFGSFVRDFINYGSTGAIPRTIFKAQAAAPVAEEGARLTEDIYYLERIRKERGIEIEQINDRIADAMLIARDASKTTAERSAAIAEAEGLIAEKKAKTVRLESALTSMYKERSSLVPDSVEAADATIAQEMRQYEVSRAITQEETALLRIKNSIGKASAAEVAAAKKRREELAKEQRQLQEYIAKRQELAAINDVLRGGDTSLQGAVITPKLSIIPQTEVDEFKVWFSATFADMTLYVGLKPEKTSVVNLTNEVNSMLETSLAKTGEIMGNLIGTLASGGDAWGDFKNAAVSALGDMAIAIGKIAIKSGVAMLGIQAALKLDNPYVAIAAGAALVALGAAVKSSLSAVASGDYSAGGGGYSGSYSSGSSGGDWDTREVTVNVTGTLTANGDQLVTVLNNTNKKNFYTM